MKLIPSFLGLILLQGAIAAVVRKPPAFSTPMFSDSYLPAAMQVIFHAVEQLKQLESEQAFEKTTVASPALHTAETEQANTQDIGTGSPIITTTKSTTVEVTPTTTAAMNSHEGIEKKKVESTEVEADEQLGDKEEAPVKIIEPEEVSSKDETTRDPLTQSAIETSAGDHQESPEMNEETPEANYATPEANYESPEDAHGTQEMNQEVPEENQEGDSIKEKPAEVETSPVAAIETNGQTTLVSPADLATTEKPVETERPWKKEPSIESIVEEIYEIVKPTPSELLEDQDTVVSGESKSSVGVSDEKMESIEEAEEETRFTLLGEKVAQVPRPSLTSYLKRAKVPPSTSLQQLGSLYDALSKDARKQGFGKYTGYSDEVLRALESSAEGGMGPQLKRILEKVVERNELTREDARTRTSQALQDLDNPGSNLNKDLRRLLPLRYSL